MEMDSTSRGRSFDRSSRNPATLKKPRLATEEATILRSNHNNNNNPNGNSRPLDQRQSVGFPPSVEREGDSDSTRGGGGGYQPQSLSQIKQQQHQELVSQYRTALAELTFNSKPIITNLTIIAGENSQAAKAIAATICNNILEVPSDQKLPSLYLLDSIVKNIGRDYIKHFSARLPEVFSKAYRQVDSAIHTGMRHLFGTWKGVFPPQSLHLIEKELGFQSAGNGSSSGLTTSRSESQRQRPGRSIHVNPKYLEARQKLQQSSRAKGATSDITTSLLDSPEDTERPDRTAANINPERAHADPRLQMHNIQQAQRDAESDLTHENSSAAYNNFDYDSDILSPSETSFGKSSGRVAELGLEKSWYGPGSNSTETISRLGRNGFDIKHGLRNYSAPGSAIADVKLQPMNNLTSKRGGEVSRSWKNSEEEEYMWDDVNSRSVIPRASGSSKRDPRLYFEPERPGFENHLQKPQRMHDLGSRSERESSSDLSTEQKDQPAFRQRILRSQAPSLTSENDHLGASRKLLDNAGDCSTTLSGVSTTVNSLSRTSLQSLTGSSHIGAQGLGIPPSAIVEQQRHTLKSATPSGQAPARQRPPSQYQSSRLLHDLAEHDRQGAHLLPDVDGNTARSRGQINTGLPSHSHPDSFQMTPQTSELGNSRKSQLHNLQPPSPQLPMSHLKKHAPILPPFQPEPISEPSALSPKLLPPQISVAANPLVSSSLADPKSLAVDIPGPSSTSSLLAAVSSIFGNKPVAGSLPESSYQSESNSQPPLPNGPPHTQFASSGSGILSSLKSSSSHESTSLSASILQRNADRLPLPLGPPPSVVGTTSSTPSSSVANSASNPVSSLLSALVAKGLISASKDDCHSSGPTPKKSQSQNDGTPTLQEVSPIVVSSVLSTSSTNGEFSLSKRTVKSTVTIPQPTNEDNKSLIGFDFRPDVIRELHPAVISELIDDLPHQCGICGLRFKLQERFDRHTEWHMLRNSESNTLNTASRGWFSNSDDWVSGKPDMGSSNKNTILMDSTEEALEINGEQMVAADESQFVCVLCGEMFDDFYSPERNKWMFKGAVYLNITDGKVGNISKGATRGPIVHENCISEHSLCDLGLTKDVKVEKGV